MNLDVWGLDKLIWSHTSSPPPDYPSFIPFDIPNSFVNMGWAGDVIQVFLEEQAKLCALRAMPHLVLLSSRPGSSSWFMTSLHCTC